MTAVLVRGNPETEAIWNPLVDAVGREDVVRLSPPGFGAQLSDDFPATYLAYREWLEGELARFDEPVDVVGHDWGGGQVVNMGCIALSSCAAGPATSSGCSTRTTCGMTSRRCGRHRVTAKSW